MPRITLAQLEAFQSIHRLGSFQAAADHLNLTQPTVSLRIQSMEHAIGHKLFHRRGRSVKLSGAGLIVLQYVEQGLGLFAEMEARMRTGNPLHGLLRIGTSNVFAMTCLAEIIATIERSYPATQVELMTANSVQLTDMLRARHLDVAFLAMPAERTDLVVEPLGESDIAWISSSSRPLKTASVRPRDLIGRNILTASPPSLLSSVISDWFAAERLPAPRLSICNNVAIIAKLVTSGVAISALPVCVVKDEIEAGSVVRYSQRIPFKPLLMSAAYQASARGAGMDAVLRIARSTVEQSGLYRVG